MRFKVRDKPHFIWLTWDIYDTFDEALKAVIRLCQSRPGKPCKIEEIH
jgi:hypothetical protein